MPCTSSTCVCMYPSCAFLSQRYGAAELCIPNGLFSADSGCQVEKRRSNDRSLHCGSQLLFFSYSDHLPFCQSDKATCPRHVVRVALRLWRLVRRSTSHDTFENRHDEAISGTARERNFRCVENAFVLCALLPFLRQRAIYSRGLNDLEVDVD